MRKSLPPGHKAACRRSQGSHVTRVIVSAESPAGFAAAPLCGRPQEQQDLASGRTPLPPSQYQVSLIVHGERYNDIHYHVYCPPPPPPHLEDDPRSVPPGHTLSPMWTAGSVAARASTQVAVAGLEGPLQGHLQRLHPIAGLDLSLAQGLGRGEGQATAGDAADGGCGAEEQGEAGAAGATPGAAPPGALRPAADGGVPPALGSVPLSPPEALQLYDALVATAVELLQRRAAETGAGGRGESEESESVIGGSHASHSLHAAPPPLPLTPLAAVRALAQLLQASGEGQHDSTAAAQQGSSTGQCSSTGGRHSLSEEERGLLQRLLALEPGAVLGLAGADADAPPPSSPGSAAAAVASMAAGVDGATAAAASQQHPSGEGPGAILVTRPAAKAWGEALLHEIHAWRRMGGAWAHAVRRASSRLLACVKQPIAAYEDMWQLKHLMPLVRSLMQQGMLPAICFNFERSMCEMYAQVGVSKYWGTGLGIGLGRAGAGVGVGVGGAAPAPSPTPSRSPPVPPFNPLPFEFIS